MGWTRIFSTYVVFFVSGIAGLGYQVVWMRMFSVGLGHETPSTLAVVTAFFGGLALGAWTLDGRVSRSQRPGRWYAVLELVIATWAVGSVWVIPALNDAAGVLIGASPSPLRHWFFAFAIPFLGLLPATAAMGATLPAMDRLVTRLHGGGRRVGGLYSVNTLGAVVGIIGTTWFLIPAAGYPLTIVVLAAGNIACAAATCFGPARNEENRPFKNTSFTDQPTSSRVLITVFMTGLFGIAFELLCVRVMSQVLAGTIYTFAAALTVYLTGTAIGAAIYHRLAGRLSFERPLVWLLHLSTLACVVTVIILRQAQVIYQSSVEWIRAFSDSRLATVGGEFMLVVCVFVVPTIVMGALFSHLAQAARGTHGGVGRAVSLNTLGGALAAPVFSVVLLPAIGPQGALLVVAAGYFVLLSGLSIRTTQLIPAVATCALVCARPADLVILDTPPGFEVTAYREGTVGSVAVLDNGQHRLLKVNNRFQMGGTTSVFGERRQAHLPLLLHPTPARALFLGVGTGVTAEASLAYDNLTVDAVELVPEVLDFTEFFQPQPRDVSKSNRIHYHHGDARRFVRASSDRWDVIVADLFHPARDGAGSLYTMEHFQAISERLEEQGLFCQWLPLYQLDLPMLASIVRTFQHVFPHTEAYIGHFNVMTPMLGLIGRKHVPQNQLQTVSQRMQTPRVAAALREVALDNPYRLYGCRMATHDQLQKIALGAPLNTDLNPVVTFQAPDFIYRGDAPAWGRLVAILDGCRSEDVAAGTGTRIPAFQKQLQSYIDARDSYLRGAILHQQGKQDEAMEAWLTSARQSPRFRTAHIVALQTALARYETDAVETRRVLRHLRRLNPGDVMIASCLRRLFRE